MGARDTSALGHPPHPGGPAGDPPFDLRRRQYPIRLAFAYTINKAQGQSLKRAGVFIRAEGVYGHGQLYTGLSRVGEAGGVVVTVDGGGKIPGLEGVYTPNVVYKEVLTAAAP